MPKKESTPEIFRRALKQKQRRQPAYSLRALARDLGVSAAFVSNTLQGKRVPPRSRLEKFFYFLELDIPEREQVLKNLGMFFTVALPSPPARKIRPRRTNEADNRGLLSSWANVAVLEGLTLGAPHRNPESLRARLGLNENDFRRVIKTLHQLGLIEESSGRWRKKETHLYVAGGRSRQEVREFHAAMIEKARAELVTKTTQIDYEHRLINGSTFALNPRQLDRLKAKIIGFLDELSREATRGPCRHVYQCNIQLFPLTRIT